MTAIPAFPPYYHMHSEGYYEKLKKNNYEFLEKQVKKEHYRINEYNNKIAKKDSFLLYPVESDAFGTRYERIPGWNIKDYKIYEELSKEYYSKGTLENIYLSEYLDCNESSEIRHFSKYVDYDNYYDYLIFHLAMRIGNKNRRFHYNEGLYVDSNDIEHVMKEFENNKDKNNHLKIGMKSITDIIAEYSLHSNYLEDSEIKRTAIINTIKSLTNFRKFNMEEYKKTIYCVSEFMKRLVSFPEKEIQKDSLVLSVVITNLYGFYSYSGMKFEKFKELFSGYHTKKGWFMPGYEDIKLIYLRIMEEKDMVNHYLKHKKSPDNKDFINLFNFSQTKNELIKYILPYMDRKEDVLNIDEAVDFALELYEEHQEAVFHGASYYNSIGDMLKPEESLKNFRIIFDNMNESNQEKTMKKIIDEGKNMDVKNQIDNYLSANYPEMIAKVARTNAGRKNANC